MLYNIALVITKHQHELAIGIAMPLPFEPPPHCVSLFYLWILNSSLYFLLVVFRKPSGGALTKYVAQNEQWLHAMLRERDKHKNKTALSIEVPEKASNVHNKK